MKVLIQMKYNSAIDKKVRKLRRDLPEVEIYTDPERTPMDKVNVLIGGVIDEALINAMKSLELIFLPFAGVEDMPFGLLDRKGIRLVNSHSGAPYVAERALGLLLDLAGKISAYHMDLMKERWHGYWGGGGMKDAWTSIRGKTCGIVGTGSIGMSMAKLLLPFKCRILGYRRKGSSCPPGFDHVFTDLHELIRESDIILMALPLTEDTYKILGEEEFALMEGKLLVNVARGKVVSESALYKSLSDNILAGAAIDTWYTYPLGRNAGAPSKYPIHKLKNVVLSPHVGGFCYEALKGVVDDIFDSLEEYIRTGKLSSLVDLKAGY
ncbi:MAG: hypothetical protein JEY99_02125 [Spirochaetales bacterium]|nr:hypothetical protein [Spirochaetales bacterium]